MRLLVVLAIFAGTAHADPLTVPGQPAELTVDAAWAAARPPDAADGPVLVMKADGGLLAVTVADAPNPDAWRDKKRAAYEQAIVDGFRAQPGVRVISSAATMVKRVPCVDVALERGGEAVAVRLLLFRTRTIAIAVSDRDAAVASAAATGLAPIHEADPDR